MLIKLNAVAMARKGKVNGFRVWENADRNYTVSVNILAIVEVRPKRSGGKVMEGISEVVWRGGDNRQKSACVQDSVDQVHRLIQEQLHEVLVLLNPPQE